MEESKQYWIEQFIQKQNQLEKVERELKILKQKNYELKRNLDSAVYWRARFFNERNKAIEELSRCKENKR